MVLNISPMTPVTLSPGCCEPRLQLLPRALTQVLDLSKTTLSLSGLTNVCPMCNQTESTLLALTKALVSQTAGALDTIWPTGPGQQPLVLNVESIQKSRRKKGKTRVLNLWQRGKILSPDI